jgi:hypothetical protein
MPLLGKCPRGIALVAAMVNDFKQKQRNTNKTQLLPSFLTVDGHKKAIQFWNPKQTLYSRH